MLNSARITTIRSKLRRHDVQRVKTQAIYGVLAGVQLEVPDNITLLKLPPYSPELNPMENVWAYLRANKLAISVFDNYEQIVDRCCEAWNFFANDKTAITSIPTRQWANTVND